MLTRIISFIMSIIISIFPFFGNRRVIDNETVAEAVIYAVENKDASAMEEVMCKNIKDNYGDLTGEINKMLSYIEGDIESISWKKFGGYYENDGNGNSVKQNDQDYIIITSKDIYNFSVVIETDNSFASEELGIRAIALSTMIVNPRPNSSYGYLHSESLYKISAVEGVNKMHD